MGVSSDWAEIVSPRYLGATTTLCLGVALLSFNVFLAAVAIPSAVQDLGGVPLIAWATTLFLVFAIMGGTAAANLKARFGARATLIGAALVFIAGSALATIAGSMPELLAGRALQGLGEGIVAAVCYALIPELFPSRLVPKVFGAESVIWALAAFGGPVLAGLLTETVSWRAAFAANLPMGAIFIALTLVVVPPRLETAAMPQKLPLVRLGLIGMAIVVISIASLLTSPVLMGLCLVIAGAMLFAIVQRDANAEVRLFPTAAFRLRDPVGAGLAVVLLMPVAQAGAAVYLVYMLQQLWDFGPLLAGFSGALMSMCWSIVAVAIAGVKTHETKMRLIRTGPALLVLGLVNLAVAVVIGQLWLVILAQILIGSGFGASWAYLSQTIMETARPGERDTASALLPTIQSAGYGIGAAIAGLAANSAGLAVAQTADAIRGAMIAVFVLCAVLSLLGLYAAFAMTRAVAKSEIDTRVISG
ncbi:MFS transporter [Pelagibacterium limicola]|uniref:MFS transporter n=1 Tax=Pelagibacterium limicola TaxID=2791022 RepID=UPI0018B01085|nr:MFS transporter [Pelagibacterium limicola]